MLAIDIMDLDLAIKLCRSTRRDVRKLLAALEHKDFYDVGHDIGHSAVNGLAFKDLPKELIWLEQLITMENYSVIGTTSWNIFDLVNYYDRLIDMIRLMNIDARRTPPIIDSLYRWRDNAGKLAQIVCQLEDVDVT